MVRYYYIYILASKQNGTLYVGMTNNLMKRICQHKAKQIDGFTKKYNVNMLVYYEIFQDPLNAIKREKRLKFFQRKWKISLIEESNPQWRDLYSELFYGSCE